MQLWHLPAICLVNLRLSFSTIAKSNDVFGAVLRFRGVTEPL
jgi:hypothetical protein